jgi:hypothetical protein
MATTIAHRYPSNAWLMRAGIALLMAGVVGGLIIWQLQQNVGGELPASSASETAFSPEAIRARNGAVSQGLDVTMSGAFSPEAVRVNNVAASTTVRAPFSPEAIRVHNGMVVPGLDAASQGGAFSPEAVRVNNVAASTTVRAPLSPEAIRATNESGS